MQFQFSPLFQTLVGVILAIIGSLIAGYFLIKSHEKAEIEKKKLEMFGDVLDNVYTPFQEIAEKINNQNEISDDNNREFKILIDDNKKFILMCPEDIKKEMWLLRENLTNNQDEAIKRIETVKRKIDELINKFVLK